MKKSLLKLFTVLSLFGLLTACNVSSTDEDGEEKEPEKQDPTPEEEHTHQWDVASYTWSEDLSTCTAKRVCKLDETHIVTETVNSVYQVVTPNCEQEGRGKYTATFTNPLFSIATRYVSIPQGEHHWGEPRYDWDTTHHPYLCYAMVTCSVCNKRIEEKASVSYNKDYVEPTYFNKGTGRYTAHFVNSFFEEQHCDVQRDSYESYFEVYPIKSGDETKTYGVGLKTSDEKHSSYNLPHFEIPETITYEGKQYNVIEFENYIGGTIDHLIVSKYVKKLVLNRDCASITVSEENEFFSSVDGVLFNKDKTTLIKFPASRKGIYTIPNTVTTIDERAFNSTKLAKLTISSSVINFDDFLSGLNLIEVVNLSSLTIDVDDRVKQVVNSEDESKVTVVEDYFIIYDGELLVQYIGEQTDVVLPDCVREIYKYSFYIDKVATLRINNGCTKIGSYALYRCTGLYVLFMPTSVTTIGSYALPSTGSTLNPNSNFAISYLGTEEQWNAVEKAEDLGNDFPVRVACTDAELTIPVANDD